MNRPTPMFVFLLALLAAPVAAAPEAPALPVPDRAAASPVERTLANGLRVVVFEDHRLPVVQVQLRVAAGTRAEPENRPGLAALTGQMLKGGTSSRTAEQFAAHLDRLGVVFGVSVLRDVALLSAGFRRSDLDAGLELVADAVTSPIFDPAAFELARRQTASQLGQQMQSLAGIAEERIQEAAFGGHPYGRPALGSLDALLQTTPGDLQRFHRERWRPDRAVLAVAGDVTPEEAFAAAEQWFERWGGRTTPDEPATVIRAARSRVVDVPDAPYAEVRVAVVGPGRRSPDYSVWSLAPARLESTGLPPGARATLTTNLDASLLVLAQPARIDSAAIVATRLRSALTTAASGAGGDAWEARRVREARAAPLALETLGSRLTQWLTDDAAGRAGDEPRLAAEAMRTGDTAPLVEALAGPVTVLAVGPAERLKPEFEGFGAFDIQPLARMLTEAPSDTLAAASDRERALGRAAVAAAVAAHGGLKALRAVRTQLADGEISLDAGGRELTSQFSSVRAPGRFVYMTKLFELETRQVLDHGAGWSLSVADSAELVELDSTAVEQLSSSRESDLIHVLLAASDPSARPALRERDNIDGREVELVDFHTARGPLRLVIDATDHRVVAIDGALSRQVWLERRRLRDYQRVGGLLLPYDEERIVEGQSLSRVRIRRLLIGAPIDEGLFKRPTIRAGRILDR